jgi:hypothetical protein
MQNRWEEKEREWVHCHCVTLMRLTSSRDRINVTSARKSRANGVLLVTLCSSPCLLFLWPRKYSIDFIPSHSPPPFLARPSPDGTGPKRLNTLPCPTHVISPHPLQSHCPSSRQHYCVLPFWQTMSGQRIRDRAWEWTVHWSLRTDDAGGWADGKEAGERGCCTVADTVEQVERGIILGNVFCVSFLETLEWLGSAVWLELSRSQPVTLQRINWDWE